MARNNEFPAFPQGGFILGAVLGINYDFTRFFKHILSVFFMNSLNLPVPTLSQAIKRTF